MGVIGIEHFDMTVGEDDHSWFCMAASYKQTYLFTFLFQKPPFSISKPRHAMQVVVQEDKVG